MKSWGRRMIAITVAGVMMLLGTTAFAAAPGLSNFQKMNSYQEGMFSDVRSTDWYCDNVKFAYEIGIMKGTSASTFNAKGNVTLAEAVTLAARLHSIYHTGTENFQQGTPWYQCYVDYAKENGLIFGDYPNFTKEALRSDFACILSRAFPKEGLSKINDVGTIPDVSPDDPVYGKEVYPLYEAGILTGSGTDGKFNPGNPIRRSEAAAIISRMADESLRVKTTPVDSSHYYSEDPLVLDFGYYCDVDVYRTEKKGNSNIYIYEAYQTDGTSTKLIDFHAWEDRLAGEGFVLSGSEKREQGYANIYTKGEVEIKAGIYKTNYFMIEVGKKGEIDAPSQEESKISTVEKMVAYLNKNMNEIKTPMGNISVETTISVNNRSYNLYDWWIRSDPGASMVFFNLKYSIDYTAEQKKETIEALRAYQKGVYDAVSKYFPDKKLYGGFYSGFYKYPNLQVGYESTKAFSWMNYTPSEYMSVEDDAYYSSQITNFHWVSTYDDYVFED